MLDAKEYAVRSSVARDDEAPTGVRHDLSSPGKLHNPQYGLDGPRMDESGL